MKLTDRIEIEIAPDGLIELRRPTNREWNEFEAARYPVRRNQIKNHAMAARVAFFDKLVTKVENIEDDDGPITIDTIDRIPDRLKSSCIFKAFEIEDGVDVKN